MTERPSVDSILADWLRRREAGEGSSAEELIRWHPEIADELRLRLRALSVVDDLLAHESSNPPERIGPYAIVREVGRGGMGVVYEARGPEHPESVALKLLYPGLADSPDLLRRLQRQVAASQTLAHPAIICHWRVERADGRWYCVSHYVHGRSLDKLVAHLLELGPPASGPDVARLVTDRAGRAAELFAPLADALQFAHEHGVIHRDIKPSNLVLGDDGHLRLTDFDLARIGGGSGAITRTGAVLGTPCYMSPEQALGKPVDERTDVYSLGATMYEWVTLERPFRGESVLDVVPQIVGREPRRPRTVDCRVPKDLQTIILKAMEKEPRRRYPSAAALAEDLRRLASGKPIVARPSSLVRRAAVAVRRRPLASAAVVLLAVLAIVAASAGSQDATRWLDAARRSSEEGDLGQAIQQVDTALRIDSNAPGAHDVRAKLERERADVLAEAARLEGVVEGKREQERREQRDLTEAEVALKGLYSLCFEEWTPTDYRHVECRKAEQARDTAAARFAALRTELASLQERMFLLKALRRGDANRVESDLARRFLDLHREARRERRKEAEAVYLEFALAHGAAQPVTGGRLRIRTDPPDAVVHLFRFEPEESGLRLVPLPMACGAAGEQPSECLVIRLVERGSAADRAGLKAGDLVLRLNGAPCGRGLFVGSVRQGGLADRAGVRSLDKIEENHGWPVETLHEWDHQQKPRRPADPEFTPVRIGGRDIQIPWGARPATALGVVPGTAEALLAEPAPPHGIRLSCLRSGVPVEVEVPEGAIAGLSCEPTACPLVLSDANLAPANADIDVDGGSYLLHAQRVGFEALRYPVVVPDGSDAEAKLRLLPDGSTPEGFIRVPGGTYTIGGDPGIENPTPPRRVELADYFIARFELTSGEYFEFLNDPETLRLIRAELDKGNCILFPRDDGGWNPLTDPDALTEILPDRTLRHKGATARTPICGINYDDAMAYLAWRNKRGGRFRYALVSEEQWEVAARGPDGRFYPWGDRFDYACCVGMHWKHKDLPFDFDAVGSEPRDESPYGVRDLAGSRREWTSPGVLKGGTYLAHLPFLYAAAMRDLTDTKEPHRYWGIRLVAVPAE